jgi:hypothetical protein
MGKQDVIAEDWARRFAWRTAESIDVPPTGQELQERY